MTFGVKIIPKIGKLKNSEKNQRLPVSAESIRSSSSFLMYTGLGLDGRSGPSIDRDESDAEMGERDQLSAFMGCEDEGPMAMDDFFFSLSLCCCLNSVLCSSACLLLLKLVLQDTPHTLHQDIPELLVDLELFLIHRLIPF